MVISQNIVIVNFLFILVTFQSGIIAFLTSIHSCPEAHWSVQRKQRENLWTAIGLPVVNSSRRFNKIRKWLCFKKSILPKQIKWSWYHYIQKTMFYLMKSKYAIFSNIKVTKIERSAFLGTPGIKAIGCTEVYVRIYLLWWHQTFFGAFTFIQLQVSTWSPYPWWHACSSWNTCAMYRIGPFAWFSAVQSQSVKLTVKCLHADKGDESIWGSYW